MSPIRISPRIIRHPFAVLMQDARLDSFEENGREIHMSVQGLEVIESELFQRDSAIMERVTGRHIPLKLAFSGIQHIKRTDFFTTLDQYPLDDPSRIIAYFYSWVQPGMDEIFHMFGLRGSADAKMNFFTSFCLHISSMFNVPTMLVCTNVHGSFTL